VPISLKSNNAHQMATHVFLLLLTEKEGKYLMSSWTEKIFPFIKEDRFGVFYSDNPASSDFSSLEIYLAN